MKKKLIISVVVILIIVILGITIKMNIKNKTDELTQQELNDMEYVDLKIENLVASDTFKNANLDERKSLTDKLLKQLKNEKFINYYEYEKTTFMFDFEYKCGVSGGVMLKEFDPRFN